MRRYGAKARSRVGLTPLGVRLAVLLFLVALGVFNTGNNLLFLIWTAGLAAFLTSTASAWMGLRAVRLGPGDASDLYADIPSLENLVAKNVSRWLDLYSLTVEEVDFPGALPRVVLPSLRSGESATLKLEKTYPHRGVFEGRRFRLSTTFPLGLCEVRREIELARRLTVFPSVKRVDISHIFRRGTGTLPYRHQAGGSEDLFRIREYAHGDSFRIVDWKATSKLSRIMVKEFAAEQHRRFCIVLDNQGNGHEGGPPDPLFETMVILAASIASHLASHQFSFRLVTADDAFPHGSSEEHLRGVLTYLARVKPVAVPVEDLVQRVHEAEESEEVTLALPGRFESAFFALALPGLFVMSPTILLPETAA